MQSEMISIVNFSENPSGRYRSDGPNSGERYREEVLLPALKKGAAVTVDLNGALGFGSSFLEEAFGGLVRSGLRLSELRGKLKIRSAVSVYETRIWRYIQEEAERQGVA